MGFISAFGLVVGVAVVMDNPAAGIALIASGIVGMVRTLSWARRP